MSLPAPKAAEERFDDKYIPVTESGCWLWLAGQNSNGYGKFSINGRRVYAHRYSYERYVGVIPEGLQIDHKCRVRCCVNPSHLEIVTAKENTRRGTLLEVAGKYQLLKTHCPHGHPYSGPNLYSKKGKKDGSVQRLCRECIRIYDVKVYPRKKQQRESRRKTGR
jgi:hypothetical protein